METDNENAAEVITIDEFKKKMTPEEIDLQVTAFLLLQQSARFVDFFDKNYELKNDVNHETKTIELLLLEKPPTKEPFLIADDTAAKLSTMLRQEFTISNPGKAVQRFMDVLNGKEEPSLIVGATDSDLDKEIAASKVQSSLLKG
jgi:hypothetical protein